MDIRQSLNIVSEAPTERKLVMRLYGFTLEHRISGVEAGYYISSAKASTKFANAMAVSQEVEDDFRNFVRVAAALELVSGK